MTRARKQETGSYPTAEADSRQVCRLSRLFGHVADISVGGMMVQTHQQVSTGDYLNLAIEIPTDIHPKPLDIHAEVTWVSEKNKHNTYSMGCRFVAIEKTERDALLELARKYPMGEEEL